MLESAYSLHDRTFMNNFGTILLFAVIVSADLPYRHCACAYSYFLKGTAVNCFIIGPVMFGLAVAGAMGPISISLIQCLVFSALIVAVDPVAVLRKFYIIFTVKLSS